jgi:magnesium transporter
MITVHNWDREKKALVRLDPEALRTQGAELRASAEDLWIDLANPTPEEEELVLQHFFPVHVLTLEDVTRLRREPDEPPHFPKVEEFPDYLFVISNPLTERLLGRIHRRPGEILAVADMRHSTQLSAVLTGNILITHHYESVPSVDALRSFLSKHGNQAQRGPDFLFHLVLDAMVDEYAPLLDHFDNALDEIEVRVFGRPTHALLVRLLGLKRAIIVLRKTLVYEREVLARLCRGEFRLIDEREAAYYRNVYDHLVRFTELIESSREMVSDLMQSHLSATSNRLNEIMKVLTMISTVVLPMTLIAGVYGMNYPLIPDEKWPYSFHFALGLMSVTGLVAFVFFKWRHWI